MYGRIGLGRDPDLGEAVDVIVFEVAVRCSMLLKLSICSPPFSSPPEGATYLHRSLEQLQWVHINASHGHDLRNANTNADDTVHGPRVHGLRSCLSTLANCPDMTYGRTDPCLRSTWTYRSK